MLLVPPFVKCKIAAKLLATPPLTLSSKWISGHSVTKYDFFMLFERVH